MARYGGLWQAPDGFSHQEMSARLCISAGMMMQYSRHIDQERRTRGTKALLIVKNGLRHREMISGFASSAPLVKAKAQP
jgi:hypothetical protein